MSHPGLWLGLLAFCVLAAVVALVRALRRGQADPYADAGEALAEEGKHEEACAMFAKALEIHPRNVKVCVQWASSLSELGRYREACEMVRRANEFQFGLLVDERGVPMGWKWEELAKCEEACERHAKAVEADPRDAGAYLGWGIALREMRRYAEAEEKWNKAIELDPALKPQIEEMRKRLLGKE